VHLLKRPKFTEFHWFAWLHGDPGPLADIYLLQLSANGELKDCCHTRTAAVLALWGPSAAAAAAAAVAAARASAGLAVASANPLQYCWAPNLQMQDRPVTGQLTEENVRLVPLWTCGHPVTQLRALDAPALRGRCHG
jgi:hypothetical protein